MNQREVLLIGGRAGVGKTTVGWEVSAQLRAAQAAHVVLEGDFLGQVHPAPEGDPRRKGIVERNLAAIWGNYVDLGYHRLIYTHTVSVLSDAAAMFERTMGPDVQLARVLLVASDATTDERLAGRELGSELKSERESSAYKARLLDEQAPSDTVRVLTDGRTVVDIAGEVLAATGWIASSTDGKSVAEMDALPSP